MKLCIEIIERYLDTIKELDTDEARIVRKSVGAELEIMKSLQKNSSEYLAIEYIQKENPIVAIVDANILLQAEKGLKIANAVRQIYSETVGDDHK